MENELLIKKCNLQGMKAFLFQYTKTFSTLPRFQKQGPEEEAPMLSRTYSCLAVEYSKGLRVQQLQSRRKIQENLVYIRRTCRPPGKVSASHVNHYGHNTAGQFSRSQAILAKWVEWNDESTELESQVPPP